MGWFSDDSEQAQSYEQYYNHPPHKAAITHELIGAAVAYEAMKSYEYHPKEIFAGFAGAIIDREVETKGLDLIDREKGKRHACQHFDDCITKDNYYR